MVYDTWVSAMIYPGILRTLLITVSRMMDVAIGGMAAKKNRLIRVSRRRNAIGISTDIVTIL